MKLNKNVSSILNKDMSNNLITGLVVKNVKHKLHEFFANGIPSTKLVTSRVLDQHVTRTFGHSKQFFAREFVFPKGCTFTFKALGNTLVIYHTYLNMPC